MKSSVQSDAENVTVLIELPAYHLLLQLLPMLNSYRFGVGGSLLLTELGLLQHARDLDLVCTEEDFKPIIQTLCSSVNPILRQVPVPPHPLYQSEYFARFVDPNGTEIDVMANIRVQQADTILSWQFDETQLQVRHSIPWMSAQQWLELYQLFQRLQRVALLRQFLFGRDSDH